MSSSASNTLGRPIFLKYEWECVPNLGRRNFEEVRHHSASMWWTDQCALRNDGPVTETNNIQFTVWYIQMYKLLHIEGETIKECVFCWKNTFSHNTHLLSPSIYKNSATLGKKKLSVVTYMNVRSRRTT